MNSNIQIIIIQILADFGVFLVAILLIFLWLYGLFKNKIEFKKKSLLIFYSIAFAFLIYVILNIGLPLRPRPENFLVLQPIITHFPDNSFPSGHAIFAGASIFGFFYYSNKQIFSLVLCFCLLMLLCRILAGIHYPSDIIVGFIIGIIGAFIIYKIKNNKIFNNYLIPYPIKIAKYLKL